MNLDCEISFLKLLAVQDCQLNHCITIEGRKRKKRDVAKLLGHTVIYRKNRSHALDAANGRRDSNSRNTISVVIQHNPMHWSGDQVRAISAQSHPIVITMCNYTRPELVKAAGRQTTRLRTASAPNAARITRPAENSLSAYTYIHTPSLSLQKPGEDFRN